MPTLVQYPSPAFDVLLDDLRARFESGKGGTVLVVGEGDARHVVLGRLAERLHAPFAQYPLDLLYDERRSAMQANLREAFDAAGETPGVLCFDYVGATMARMGLTGTGGEVFTPIDYLFERGRSFHGLLVVCVRDPSMAETVAPRATIVVRVGA